MNASQPDQPSSWAVENAEAEQRRRPRRFLWIGLAVVVALVAAAAIATVALNRAFDHDDLAWPASIGGRPAGLGQTNQKAPDVSSTAKPGAYVWNDFDGFHLWIVDGGTALQGTLSSDEDFGETAVAVPGAGTVAVDGKKVTFDLPASDGIVGVDFNPGFYARTVTVTLTGADGAKVFDGAILVGRSAKATPQPVTLKAVDKDVAASS